MESGEHTLKRQGQLCEQDDDTTTGDKIKSRKWSDDEEKDDSLEFPKHRFPHYISKAKKTGARVGQNDPIKNVAVRNDEQRPDDDEQSLNKLAYPQDFCKDYIDTKTCFVEGCKFIHNETDFNFGWPEKEEGAENADKTYGSEDDDVASQKSDDETFDREDTPETCFFCREEFLEVAFRMKCGHMFCEDCSTSDGKIFQKCPMCSKPTDGYVKHITITRP